MYADTDPDEAEFLSEFADPLREVRVRHARCPSPHLLNVADAGVLPEGLAASLAAHVESCPMCQRLRSDLSEVSATDLSSIESVRIRTRVFDAAKAGRRPVRPSVRLWWPAAAAAGALAASLAVWVMVGGTTAPPQTAEPALRVAAAFDPPSALALETRPTLKVPADLALSWRGSDASDAALREAIARYETGDIAGAAVRLRALRDGQERPEVGLYLGICDLLLGQNDEAADALESARQIELRSAPDVAWYLAIAHARLGATAQAVGELAALCGGGSEYAERACAARLELSRRSPNRKP